MNAKCVVALILVLQASMSLCEIPTPSQELVEKYDDLKSVFLKRLKNLYAGTRPAAALPPEQQQKAEEFFTELQDKPEFQALVKVATGVGREAEPLVVKARTILLGLYEHYLRPHVGTQLNDFINKKIKPFLDQVMPAE